jgi:DNA-binding transcriptional ArsR family regulator
MARNDQRHEIRAAVIKALAHPTRVMIAEALGRRKEMCVCELTELAGVDISTVSKHLAVMKNAGLLKVEKRGLNQYYRLHCICLNDFFTCIDGIARARANDLKCSFS